METEKGFDVEKFKKNFSIKVKSMESSLTESKCVLDVKGIDAALANTLRRLMLSRVYTMAIDSVTIEANSSVMADEVMAHRLGLIPLRAPPSKFAAAPGDSASYDAENSLKFVLDVTCVKDGDEHSMVYSRDLRWAPHGDQKARFKEHEVGPVHEDILICKLGAGQSIKLWCLAVLGRGETHTKWSPVATAFYRMLPSVTIKEKVVGEDATKLKELCPVGVFDVEDLGKKKMLVVKNERACTLCRECTRHEQWKGKIEVKRHENQFEFTIESSGTYDAVDILREALNELKRWMEGLRKEIKAE